ncbi:MAG TPA: YvcK family protein [Leptolyngbyaceae cyanobacterium M65_K2018_010]|nr:YvcK family protein [Leptolyngbyaceae cyanobacterium M65_K2018_010]
MEENQRPKVVLIGGGTGISTLLAEFKKVAEVTAIVSMMDSGGSSGRLRDEHGILPPGDILKCLAELLPEDTQGARWRDLLNYRFLKGDGLKGHSLGNLLLAAAYDWEGGAAFGIEAIANLLKIQGQVLPVTLNDVNLIAKLSDGRELISESQIDLRTDRDRWIEYIYLSRRAKIYGPAAQAIRSADHVIIGPGSLFTSILPNFLVEGLVEALRETPAPKTYVLNLVTDPAETHGYKASNFIEKVEEYLGPGDRLDYAVINTGPVEDRLKRLYALENKFPVEADLDHCQPLLSQGIISGNFVSGKTVLRHNSQQLVKTLLHHDSVVRLKRPSKVA